MASLWHGLLGVCCCTLVALVTAKIPEPWKHHEVPKFTLRNGMKIPALGHGLYLVQPEEETYNAVTWALRYGYRMFDTGQWYRNEADVGEAIRHWISGEHEDDDDLEEELERLQPRRREDLWVQTKLHQKNHGYNYTLTYARESLEKINLGYVDCFLFYGPDHGWLVESYDALLLLMHEGLVKSVGVSNFDVAHIEMIMQAHRPPPLINQIEISPNSLREHRDLIHFHETHGILTQCYGCMMGGMRKKLHDPHVSDVVERHPHKTAAQILLRYAYQKGFQSCPRSHQWMHIKENIDIFDFELSEDDIEHLEEIDGQFYSYWKQREDYQPLERNVGELYLNHTDWSQMNHTEWDRKWEKEL